MFGLPLSTFLWVVVPPVLSVILAVVYGATFQDDDSWWTIEDLFRRKNTMKGEVDDDSQ